MAELMRIQAVSPVSGLKGAGAAAVSAASRPGTRLVARHRASQARVFRRVILSPELEKDGGAHRSVRAPPLSQISGGSGRAGGVWRRSRGKAGRRGRKRGEPG